MKILVCGVTGFMGKNIYDYFKALGFDVWGCARRGTLSLVQNDSHIVLVDLTDEGSVNRLFLNLQPDVVIQAAATTSGSKDILTKPYIHVTDNAVMNSLLLRACHDHNVKHFLFLSCCVMYQPGDVPRKESDFNPAEPLYKSYFGVGWTKIYIEKMCEFYSRLGRVKCTVIRHSNTYGPYDKYDLEHSHVFGATIRKVMEATDKLVVWGKGEEARDLLYVTDVVRAIDILIKQQTEPFELVNVSYGSAIRIKDLVNEIVASSGKTLEITHDLSAPSIPTVLAVDHSYMTQKYGWVPEVSISEGIRLTLDWYNKNVDIRK